MCISDLHIYVLQNGDMHAHASSIFEAKNTHNPGGIMLSGELWELYQKADNAFIEQIKNRIYSTHD